jgi:hypothetical protein
MRWSSFTTRALRALQALAIISGFSLMAQAGVINNTAATSFGFTTSGQIGTDGVTGFNAISFRSQADPIWGTTGTRYLGQFLTAPLPPGVTTTYNNTSFSISLLPVGLQLDGNWYTQNLQPVVLKGRLNGTLNGSDYSNVVASFDPVNPWVDIVQGGLSGSTTFLSGVGPFVIKSAGTTDATMSWLTLANPSPVPVPEPTTLAIFASGMAIAWAARRRQEKSA